MEKGACPSGTRERQSNIELLRIVVIIGVIILHYNGEYAFDVVAQTGINWWILCSLESVFICAVNVFVLITGYFLSCTDKRNLWKAIELVVQVILFSSLRYLLDAALFGGAFRFRGLIMAMIPNDYFVTLYIVLYLISPYINMVFDRLTQAQMRKMVFLLFLLFSAYPNFVDIFQIVTRRSWNEMSSISMFGSLGGYSIVNFVLMYSIGAYLRRGKCALCQWKTCRLLLLWLVCVIGLIVWNYSTVSSCAWHYCNPLVIISAVCAFLLFKRIQIGSCRIINTLAQGVFSVYLFHFFFLPHIGIEEFAVGNPFILLAHIFLSAIGIYGLCWCVYWVYTKITKPLFRRLSAQLDLNIDYLK